MTPAVNTHDRAMHIERLINAPLKIVWEVWTHPEHIAVWWGPNGFTNTIHTMDVQEGGEWHLTMHGPNGINYPNKSIYREIIPFQKIVFEHFNPHFITTVLIEPKGDQTYLRWTGVFDTVEMHDIVVKAHKADEGLKQNVERLEAYLLQFS